MCFSGKMSLYIFFIFFHPLLIFFLYLLSTFPVKKIKWKEKISLRKTKKLLVMHFIHMDFSLDTYLYLTFSVSSFHFYYPIFSPSLPPSLSLHFFLHLLWRRKKNNDIKKEGKIIEKKLNKKEELIKKTAKNSSTNIKQPA